MEKYQNIKELGRGTFGVVSEALNLRTRKIVAVKKLFTQYSEEECMNLVEVKSLRKLNNHPNIVKLKEIITENDNLFMVFEYMECNLDELMLKRTKPFSETEIRNFYFQLFQGIAYMHCNGYFHRDLKPNNLLVSKDVIKIGDLGQAREIDDQGPYTCNVSTLWYRAPEIFLNSPVYSSAIDMWAMGAIMVELFTLQPLFKGSSELDVMHKICSVLGTPTETIWTAGLYYACNIDYQFPKLPGEQFSDLLPSASSDAVNLIATLLSWNPDMRLTAMDALQHPFFSSCYHDPSALSHEAMLNHTRSLRSANESERITDSREHLILSRY